MKKHILILLILTLIILNIYPSENGLKIFKTEDENQLMTILYNDKKPFYKTLFAINENKTEFKEITEFYKYIDLNTILGNTIHDSLILYINFNHSSELVDSINYQKNPELQSILAAKLFPEKFARSNHSFSVFPNKFNFGKSLSIIIPKINWQPEKNSENEVTIVGGDDNCALVVFYKKEKIKNEKDILDHEFAKEKSRIFKEWVDFSKSEESQKNKFFMVEPGELKLISSEIQLGNKQIKKIYEQITISPEKYKFQLLLQRTRYYLIEDDLYIVRLKNVISGIHPLANAKRISNLQGLLLDTVLFL